VDLTQGPSLYKLGADAELSVGRDRVLTRTWSEAFHAHPCRIDGLAYVARHGPRQDCCATFDRVIANLEIENQFGLWEYHLGGGLDEFIEKYGIQILS